MPAKLEKQGKKWTFRYRHNGTQLRKTLKTTDYRIAKYEQIKFLAEIGLSPNQKDDTPLKTHIDKYILYSKNSGNTKNSISTKVSVLNNFFSFMSSINKRYLSEIKSVDLEAYKASRLAKKVSYMSINTEIKIIKACFNKAVEWELILKAPTQNIKFYKIDQKPPRFLSKDEINSFINAPNIPMFYRTMFMIGLYAGFRISEAYGLQWKDVDFEKKTISPTEKTKGYKKRIIPLHPQLNEFLRNIKEKSLPSKYVASLDDGKHPSLAEVFCVFGKIFKSVGIRSATFHVLRHSFASYLLMNGVDIFTVSKLLGHQSVNITMIYSHLSQTHLQNEVNRLKY